LKLVVILIQLLRFSPPSIPKKNLMLQTIQGCCGLPLIVDIDSPP